MHLSPAVLVSSVAAIAATVALVAYSLLRNVGPQDPGPVPVTKPVLELMPESAGLALGIPPVHSMNAKMMDTIIHFLPADMDSKTVVADFMSYLGTLVGVEDANRAGDLLAITGIEPDTPFGLYLGYLPPKEVPEPSEAVDEDAPNPLLSIRVPPMAIAFTYSDPERIHGWVDSVLGVIPEALNNAPAEEEYQGVTLRTLHKNYGAYFFSETMVVLSTSAPFAREIADRLIEPREVRYGTAECRAGSPNELVAMAHMDRMAPTISSVMNFVVGALPAAELVESEWSLPAEMFDHDPAYLTFDFSGPGVELVARLDLAEHDEMRDRLGRPDKLRLAAAAPVNTQALLSLRFNNSSKDYMLETFATLFSGASETMPIDFPVGESMGDLIQFVDDEVTLALTGMVDDVPTGIGMLALNSRDAITKFFISAPIPGKVVDRYKRADILTMPQSNMYYSITRNTFVVGNNIDEVKECIRHLMDKKSSGAFEAFSPDIDPDVPRYAGLFVKPGAVPESVSTFLELNTLQKTLLSGASGALNDVRVSGDFEGTWLESRIVVRWRERAEPVVVATGEPVDGESTP